MQTLAFYLHRFASKSHLGGDTMESLGLCLVLAMYYESFYHISPSDGFLILRW